MEKTLFNYECFVELEHESVLYIKHFFHRVELKLILLRKVSFCAKCGSHFENLLFLKKKLWNRN